MKKFLLIFNIFLVIYLVGYTVLFTTNKIKNEGFVNSLVDIRKFCNEKHKDNFKNYLECLKENEKKSEDPIARPIVSLPPADYSREYKAALKPKNSTQWQYKTLQPKKQGDILVVDIYKEALEFKNKESDLAGLLWVLENYNFGEMTIVQQEEGSLPLEFRPYSEEGYILFDLKGAWFVIMTSDMPEAELNEKLPK